MSEIDATIDSALSAGKRKRRPPRLRPRPSVNGVHPSVRPADFPKTDAGNAELIAALYAGRLLYDHKRKAWYLFREHRWVEDAGRVEAIAAAKAAARARLKAAEDLDSHDSRQSLVGWAFRSESSPRLDAALRLAASDPLLSHDGLGWDRDQVLLGVSNGVIDLRTGLLRPGSPADRIRLSSPVPLVAGSACPRWERFLLEVCDGEDDLVDFLWRAIGYSLTGLVTEQCFFLIYGPGANGKSLFLDVLRALAGDYAANTGFSTFELDARSSISNELAALAGKRIVTASESDQTRRLNEARMKALAHGDVITARFLYSEPFDFPFTAKIWLTANHTPFVRDSSYGFWRSVRLIPFRRTFPLNDRLKSELLAELPGILGWAIRGSLEWQARGLGMPAAVSDATTDYERDSNPLLDFLSEMCEQEPAVRESSTKLWVAYQGWCAARGIQEEVRVSQTQFGLTLATRYAPKRTNAGKFYVGLRLRPE